MNETNGKIRGKFNIIDLIIVILLLAAVAFLGYRFLTRGNADADTQKVYLTMTGAEVSKYVGESVDVNDDRDSELVIDYARWMWLSRSEPTVMPASLKYRLNCRAFDREAPNSSES